MEYINRVELIQDEGEHTGSFIKLQPIARDGGSDSGTSFARISHMTIGKFNSGDGTAIGPTNDITSSFIISGSGGGIEAPIYAFKLAAGGVLAYKNQAGGNFVAP
mgnify:CR=1 FL=1